MIRAWSIPIPLWALLAGCAGAPPAPPVDAASGRDPHSFARADQVAVEHLALDVQVDFERRRIVGTASLSISNRTGARELWLDSRDLDVHAVRLEPGNTVAEFRLGDEVPFLGRPLVVSIEPDTTRVHVDYASRPEAVALQWLEPRQTAAGRRPFLLTQSQPIYARSWIPCQDSPGIRMTYDAVVRVPPGLLALMSAENPTAPTPDGAYRFRMRQPIPAYLLALAVGEIEFRPIGSRSGVYAEPPILEAAAWEFADTERMIEAAERLYGPYRWERFDVIVLPRSFPFGGMENPRLTFVTPTLLAGDRSLVSTIAHELAHSWSGNLVTSADWNDFWLNEGFTSYFEKRIMEELYGPGRAATLGVLDLGDLVEEMKGLDDAATHLHLDLAGRDPEEGSTYVPYEKGSLFLRMLEEAFGREAWDGFVSGYFDEFAFGSMTSERFLAYLRAQLIEPRPDATQLEQRLDLDGWVYGPGLPANCPVVRSPSIEAVESALAAWRAGSPSASLGVADWTALERLHFVRNLPDELSPDRLAELDAMFGLTESGNAELHQAWLLRTIGRDYPRAEPALERFLTTVGRLKYLKPLYTRLATSPEGLERARRIYRTARPGYHAITVAALDPILGWPDEG